MEEHVGATTEPRRRTVDPGLDLRLDRDVDVPVPGRAAGLGDVLDHGPPIGVVHVEGGHFAPSEATRTRSRGRCPSPRR